MLDDWRAMVEKVRRRLRAAVSALAPAPAKERNAHAAHELMSGAVELALPELATEENGQQPSGGKRDGARRNAA